MSDFIRVISYPCKDGKPVNEITEVGFYLGHVLRIESISTGGQQLCEVTFGDGSTIIVDAGFQEMYSKIIKYVDSLDEDD